MLATLNEYSALINFALFGAVIGFLFHLQKTSREALTDKFEAQLELQKSKITLLETQERITLANHQAAIKLLEQQLTFYKSLADMPEDRRVLAIKSEYQQKLAEVEAELSRRGEVEGQLKLELVSVREEAQLAAKSPSLTQQAAMRVLERVVRLTIDSIL